MFVFSDGYGKFAQAEKFCHVGVLETEARCVGRNLLSPIDSCETSPKKSGERLKHHGAMRVQISCAMNQWRLSCGEVIVNYFCCTLDTGYLVDFVGA